MRFVIWSILHSVFVAGWYSSLLNSLYQTSTALANNNNNLGEEKERREEGEVEGEEVCEKKSPGMRLTLQTTHCTVV